MLCDNSESDVIPSKYSNRRDDTETYQEHYHAFAHPSCPLVLLLQAKRDCSPCTETLSKALKPQCSLYASQKTIENLCEYTSFPNTLEALNPFHAIHTHKDSKRLIVQTGVASMPLGRPRMYSGLANNACHRRSSHYHLFLCVQAQHFSLLPTFLSACSRFQVAIC